MNTYLANLGSRY